MSSRSSRVLFALCVLAFVLDMLPERGHAQSPPGGSVISMAVGGVTSSSARFRVQATRPDSVNIEVATDTVSAPSIFGSPVKADPRKNNTVLIDVRGLQPNHQYYYRAWVGGTAQPGTQKFTTFPIEGAAAKFTFGFGSCQQSGSLLPSASPGKVFSAVVNSGASFFLQLGDWGYPDSVDDPPLNNNFFSGNFTLVQQSYRAKFDPNYPMSAVQRMMPVDYVYDDHDYMNNNASATTSSYFNVNQSVPGVTVLEIPNPPAARENSIKGYIENMPTYTLANDSRGIYHRFTVGNADFFMLDLRSQRSPNLESFSRNSSTGKWEYNVRPGHSILASPSAPGTGPTELTWLLDGLKNSKAKWKFLVSSVPFNRAQSVAITLGLLLQDSVAHGIPGIPSGTPALFAALEFADKWVGFPADADTLLKTIREYSITNVIMLSGDSHTAALDDGANAGLPELMAGCLDISNSGMAAAFATVGFRIWNRGGQGLTTSLFNNAFGMVTVYGADSVALQLVDENGTVFASHTVQDGQTGAPREREIPAGFALEQNYPNPFNPLTIINYTVGAASDGSGPSGRDSRSGGPEWQVAEETGPGDRGLGARVKLTIYDVLGREVAVLVDEPKVPGSYAVSYNGGAMASGIYFYRLSSGSFVQTRAMVLVK